MLQVICQTKYEYNLSTFFFFVIVHQFFSIIWKTFEDYTKNRSPECTNIPTLACRKKNAVDDRSNPCEALIR